jgi:hypothetical protein
MALKFALPLLAYLCFVFQGQFPHPMDPIENIERLDKTDLSPQEKKAIANLVLGNKPVECVSPGSTLKKEIDSIQIVKVELARGEKDLLVQASDRCNCSPTGNCEFWIVRKSPDGFETLLETGMVQTFSVETISSHGHKDVMTADHGSATNSDLALYQFDGKNIVILVVLKKHIRKRKTAPSAMNQKLPPSLAVRNDVCVIASRLVRRDLVRRDLIVRFELVFCVPCGHPSRSFRRWILKSFAHAPSLRQNSLLRQCVFQLCG